MSEPFERYWVALFSQTGSEIVNVSKQIGRWPDLILTNQTDETKVNPALVTAVIHKEVRLAEITTQITAEVYRIFIPPGALVTLHGWLKIVPPEICDEYEIYNGHPGLITKYPELKGKDPQKKALELKLPMTGTVIHSVTKEVDSGEIVYWNELDIMPGESLESLTERLHKLSEHIWVKFLKQKLAARVMPEEIQTYPGPYIIG